MRRRAGPIDRWLRSLGRAPRECGTLPLHCFAFQFFFPVLSEGRAPSPLWRGLWAVLEALHWYVS